MSRASKLEPLDVLRSGHLAEVTGVPLVAAMCVQAGP